MSQPQTAIAPRSASTVERMAMADYIAAPGLSKHALDLFAECPEKFQLKASGLFQDKPSDAMLFGRCAHSAVFESRREYQVKPETYGPESKPWNGNAAFCKQWLAERDGAVILSRAQDEWISALCAKVRADKLAAPLLAEGRAELSLFGHCPETDLLLKGRPDWTSMDCVDVVDLKTIANASTRNCEREIVKRRYHVQAAMYFKLLRLLGHAPRNFYFIFVETGNAAPLLNVRRLGDATLHLGEAVLADELKEFRACHAANYWPGYSGSESEIRDIDVPDWAFTDGGELEMEN